MGDKSPKSKERNRKQRDVSRAEDAAAAKAKHDSQARLPQLPRKTGK